MRDHVLGGDVPPDDPNPVPADIRPAMKEEAQLTPLEKGRLRQAELRARGEFVRLNPIDKAKANPTSLRLAITAKCYDCEGQDADPGVRQRIATCGIKTCPLWPVRPWQRLAQGDDDGDGDE